MIGSLQRQLMFTQKAVIAPRVCKGATRVPWIPKRTFHRSIRRKEQEKGKGDMLSESPKGFDHSSKQQEWLWRLCLGTFVGATGYLIYRFWVEIFSSNAQNKALKEVENIPLIKTNPVVYMDIEADGNDLGRIVIQLRKDVVPKTTEVSVRISKRN